MIEHFFKLKGWWCSRPFIVHRETKKAVQLKGRWQPEMRSQTTFKWNRPGQMYSIRREIRESEIN